MARPAPRNRLLNLMADGKCPWRKPWQAVGTGLPVNAVSKREYRGVNTWLLGSMPFNDNRWISFRQPALRQFRRGIPRGNAVSVLRRALGKRCCRTSKGTSRDFLWIDVDAGGRF